MPTLLIVDDEPGILQYFRLAFPDPELTLVTTSTGCDGVEKFAQCRPDVAVFDIDLPDITGLEVFRRVHRINPRVPVIFITGRGTTDSAIEAMTLGVYEYLLKPLDLEQMRSVVFRAVEISRLMQVPALLTQEPIEGPSDVLVGLCPAMQDVYKAIGRVAPQELTVLITGESGTGKELVARAIYHYSRRSSGPFLAINCAAIPETLLESELFGHEKGSFTGADRRRIGKFEQCNGGTLFLDEIGDMTSLTQTKILRVLQEQRFERVGGNETIQTNVRVLAATNRNLEQLVVAGQFRQDLYYRLNVFTIRLPPLRERAGDMPMLVDHFVRRFRRELGKEVQGVAPETIDLLQRYPWPGNLRELQSVLKQSLLQATGPILSPDFLPALVRDHDPELRVPAAASAGLNLEQLVRERWQAGSKDLYAECLAQVEQRLFSQVLRLTNGNLSQAARVLGIHRATLRTKLAALGISADQAGTPDE
jgi:two-component system nitrogen regulation response regulator GlnG